MSLSFEDIKKRYIGKWRIRAWGAGYIVDRRYWYGWQSIYRSEKVMLFDSIDLAKAYIDEQIQDRFVKDNKRGESKFTIYYP